MFICLCHGYTDRQIHAAAARCQTVSELYRRLGSEPRCGKCVPLVAQMHKQRAGGIASDGDD